jgi:hypothetical protein
MIQARKTHALMRLFQDIHVMNSKSTVYNTIHHSFGMIESLSHFDKSQNLFKKFQYQF